MLPEGRACVPTGLFFFLQEVKAAVKQKKAAKNKIIFRHLLFFLISTVFIIIESMLLHLLLCRKTHSLILAVLLPTQILRSEEHTSELQSRPHLVCRLLLE